MKIQDMVFWGVLVFLLFKKRSVYFAAAGLVCLFSAIPLFAKWVFFTAEHLTWYAAAFFLLSAIFRLLEIGKHSSLHSADYN